MTAPAPNELREAVQALALETLRVAAPGVSVAIREHAARSIALKVEGKVLGTLIARIAAVEAETRLYRSRWQASAEASRVFEDERDATTARADEEAARSAALVAEVERLREALKPFAAIAPSTLYEADGSDGEAYTLVITASLLVNSPASVELTGFDLARARAALKPQEAGDGPK